MATCKDCLHFEACVAFMYSETDCCGTIEECKEKHANDEVCGLFKSATDVMLRSEAMGRIKDLVAEVSRIIHSKIRKIDSPIGQIICAQIIGEAFTELTREIEDKKLDWSDHPTEKGGVE